MSGRKGQENFDENWKNLPSLVTKVKKRCKYYTKTSTGFVYAGFLDVGTEGEYVQDSQNTNTRSKFIIENNTFYINVDNLVKAKSISDIDLSPRSFELEGKRFSKREYISQVKSKIKKFRKNKTYGELWDYLDELVSFASNSKTTFDIQGINFDNFPWDEITKKFSEVVLPIAVVSNKVSLPDINYSQFNDIVIPRINQSLYDFELGVQKRGILVKKKFSVKSESNITNQIKPSSIISALKYSSQTIKQNKAYRVLQVLDKNSMILGPLYAWQVIAMKYSKYKLTIDQIKNYFNNYKNKNQSNLQLSVGDLQIWNSFLNFYKISSAGITYGKIRQELEKLIESESKETDFNNDLNFVFINFESNVSITFMKLTIDNYIPKFEIKPQSIQKGLYLRSSNSENSMSDKIGIQLIF